MAKRLILVTDDDPDIRAIFETILESRGFAVMQATSGEEAIDLARRHQPDLVFMDLMMPSMSGWDATAVLKAGSPEVGAIPIVAVTALQPSAATLRDAGFCAALTKPVAPLAVVKAADICLDASSRGEHWISDLAHRIASSG